MGHGNPTRQHDRFNTAHQVSRAMSAQSENLPRSWPLSDVGRPRLQVSNTEVQTAGRPSTFEKYWSCLAKAVTQLQPKNEKHVIQLMRHPEPLGCRWPATSQRHLRLRRRCGAGRPPHGGGAAARQAAAGGGAAVAAQQDVQTLQPEETHQDQQANHVEEDGLLPCKNRGLL